MKKLFLPFFILISVASYATIRTVSNLPATIAQYSNIQLAIDASSDGDTVYVHGSPNAYSGFTITGKKIIVVGPGWSPNKNLPLVVNINSNIYINTIASNGSELNGLIFNNSCYIYIQASANISNIKIIRNQFYPSAYFNFSNGTATYTGFLFEGNYFKNSQILNQSNTNSFANFMFKNNLFIEDGSNVNGNLSGFVNCSAVLFDHNLFYGGTSGVRNIFSVSTASFLLLTNNIFVRRDAGNFCSNSTFNNNITFNAGTDPWAINSNNGVGNVSNQDPKMFDQASVNNGVNDPLLDFTIATGPANNSGSDGKDMGLLYDATGSLNWASSRTSYFPFIFSMSISNTTISAGGTLNVTVVAKKDN